MPELPEVETVRRGLSQLVVGKTIKRVVVRWPRIIESPEVSVFCRELVGQVIKAVNRRGKYLIFQLTNYDMVSHLRMEGKYEYFAQDSLGASSQAQVSEPYSGSISPEELGEYFEQDELGSFPVTKHTHVLFFFTDGSQLQYRDVRKFGRMALIPKGTAKEYKGITRLGPEPLPEEFTLADFKAGLLKSHKAIKPLLLDQRLVTGLGNIYVDEALWQAKIHPEQPSNTLSDGEIATLRLAILDVLQRAVSAGGTTIRTYLNALGEAGKFQLSLNVYGQTGNPCPRCGTPIEKIKVAQRGTHFCPTCQKLRQRKARVLRKVGK